MRIDPTSFCIQLKPVVDEDYVRFGRAVFPQRGETGTCIVEGVMHANHDVRLDRAVLKGTIKASWKREPQPLLVGRETLFGPRLPRCCR